MHVGNVLHAALWKYSTQAKNRHLGTIAQLCRAVYSQLRHVSTIGKKLAKDTASTCPHNMVNFGLLMAEICWRVRGTPVNFNGFRFLAALLHGIPVWQGGHHVGHWPTFLVSFFSSPNFTSRRFDVCHSSTHGVASV